LATLRAQDRLRLFELHSRDVLHLRKRFEAEGTRVIVEHSDGFAGLKAVLPPPPRRALVLIDPAYEEKHDYERVVQALKDSCSVSREAPTSCGIPQLTRLEAHDLPGRLKRLPASNWLHVTLRVRTPAADGFGMHGSGVFVINPPWTLQASLEEVMPWLVRVLGLDAGAGFTLESQAS
jgi:23S rRNA (adenine2030-N6)-methyltransferase